MRKQGLILSFLIVAALHVFGQSADSLVLKKAVLYYYTYGSGEPIIILSGGPGVASHQEDDVAARLSKRYKAILFDQQGTGRSWTKPLDSTIINVQTAIGDLELLRQHLGIQKMTLYGHSWGSMLAAGYISRYPGHVKIFISVCGGELDASLTQTVNQNVASKLKHADSVKYTYWREPAVVKRDSARAAYEQRRIRVMRSVFDTTQIDAVMKQVSHGSSNRVMSALMWKSLSKDLHFIKGDQAYTGRALIVFGWNDMISLTTATQYKEAFPEAEVKGIFKCGHYPETEQPDEFYRVVEDYLSSNLPAR